MSCDNLKRNIEYNLVKFSNDKYYIGTNEQMCAISIKYKKENISIKEQYKITKDVYLQWIRDRKINEILK